MNVEVSGPNRTEPALHWRVLSTKLFGLSPTEGAPPEVERTAGQGRPPVRPQAKRVGCKLSTPGPDYPRNPARTPQKNWRWARLASLLCLVKLSN